MRLSAWFPTRDIDSDPTKITDWGRLRRILDTRTSTPQSSLWRSRAWRLEADQ
jgi:hypothetical protein